MLADEDWLLRKLVESLRGWLLRRHIAKEEADF